MSATENEIDVADQLARMIAASSSFQEHIAKYTQDSAMTRVHQVFAQDPDNLPRPFALIEFGDMNSVRTAGGYKNTFATEASMILRLAGEMENKDDPAGSMKRFRRWAEKVHLDILDLAGLDDYLNVTGMEQEQVPTMSHELGGDVVPWLWTSWRVMYGTY